jgi:two-component system secretion system response regulator SalR
MPKPRYPIGTVYLTLKEARIVSLLCEGYSRKQMAAMLGNSENTLNAHMTSILRKCNCHKNTEVVLLASMHGFNKKGYYKDTYLFNGISLIALPDGSD